MGSDVDVVYRGARGSNTGDEFHELWAARQCLRLLDPSSGVLAVKVEGTQSAAADHFWDSADCSLYFGGTSNADAERVEIQQLKYSAANPDAAWTVARLVAGRDGKPSTSVIGGLAKAYKKIKEERAGKPTGSLRFSLVSNQPIHANLQAAIDAAREGVSPSYDRPWKDGDTDLHRLVHASGLTSTQFCEFASLFDLTGSTGSRFAVEDSFLGAVSEWTDIEFAESAQRIRTFVRQRMMPEAAGEIINRDRLLAQFDISDERALFPCPPTIKRVENSIPRSVASEIVARLLAGSQRLCLHGGGGVGKTTVLQQVERLLPSGSEMVVFDCYGGGSYLDASVKRHRPADAFVQLSNDLASRLRLPILLDRRGDIDYPRAFRKRLDQAANIIARTRPGALLVVSIDAADNSIAAARARIPEDPSFVHDIQSFQNLPTNVRLLVSARTGRLPDLRLPAGFEEVLLPAFTPAETAANVQRYWNAPPAWIDDFHHLSTGVPRVQAYAFDAPASTPSEAIENLRPFGKKLDHIFRDLFDAAFKKLGQQADLERVCAGLIALPRPIPIGHLAAILSMSESLISDICSDLSPGVRRSGDLLSFADEDFEAFVREAASSALPAIFQLAAERLLSNHRADQYAALHVAPLLLQAGREQDLLNLVESEPEPAAIVVSDPVVRHEIRLQRLVVAISVCRHAGDVERALHFVLIGAEAKNTEASTLSLLTVTPSLTAKFARDTGSRRILSDPHHIADQGPLLLHLMAEDAANGEAVAVRETRRRFRAWAQRRDDDYELRRAEHEHAHAWEISEEDAACLLYSVLLHDGVPATIERLRHFKPLAFAVLAAKALIERLASERRFKELEDLAAALPAPKAVFLLVPLAMAGHQVNLKRLAVGVAALKRRFKLDLSVPRETYSEPSLGNYYVDTALCAAEVLVARGGSIEVVNTVLSSFLSIEGRRIDKRYPHEVTLIDAILRSYCLAEALAGREPNAGDVLTSTPLTEEEKKQSRGRSDRSSHEQELRELMTTLIGPYSARAQILSGTLNTSEIEAVLAKGSSRFHSESWRLDRHYSSGGIRARLAENQTVLLSTAADPKKIMASAWGFQRGHWPLAVAAMVQRLSAIEALHEDLLATLTRAAANARRERIGAEDKSRNLAGYAKLLAPISRSDAKIIFQQAIEVASELDSEAMDQIRLIDRLVGHADTSLATRRRQSAMAFGEVFRDAAIRLDNVDHFPWDQGFSALSRLDFGIALACAARWSDADLVSLSRSIGRVASIAVDRHEISSAAALALLSVADRPMPDNFQAILASAPAGGKASAIADEMAHDILADRLAGSTEASAFIERHSGGDWARRYVTQTQFEAGLPSPDSVTAKGDRSTYTKPPRPTLQSQTWPESDLVDGLKLAEKAASVLAVCRAAGESLALDDVLQCACNAVPVGRRSEHLTALLQMQDVSPDRQIIEALLRAARGWQAQPSVAAWCRQHIPVVIADHLDDFARYLPWEDRWLGPAIELSGMTSAEAQTALLTGIERSSEYLSAQVTFALVGDIGLRLAAPSAARLCEWYLDRLLERIPSEDREPVPSESLPITPAEAIGRFIYSILGEIDLRARWRAAHAVRRLARLGEVQLVNSIAEQYDRKAELAFREPTAPFYWVAARLWLVIALDRVAEETPSTISSLGPRLLAIALDDDFPHLILRDYARDACLKLGEAGLLVLGDQQRDLLQMVNKSPLPGGAKRDSHRESFDTLHRYDDPTSRFRFDAMDTLRYWYEPWLRMFEGVSSDNFLKTTESWIVDRWGVLDEKPYGSKEPRSSRFSDRTWSLSSTSHGSLPTLERHRSHLEWHAMWCSVGELIKTNRITPSPYNDHDHDELAYQISQEKLTHPPVWLADLVGPRPLQAQRWRRPASPPPEWFSQIGDDEFLSELLPSDKPAYLIAHAHIDARWNTYRETVRISSALVSPSSAGALVRALQCMESESDYYLCPEGHELEIDEPDHKLLGWLKHSRGDSGFDRKDVFKNGISGIDMAPGDRATRRLGLTQSFRPSLAWFRPDQAEPAFLYEAWGEREQEDQRERYYGDAIVSEGHRLLVRADTLKDLLDVEGFDLITEIGVRRHARGERQRSYDSEDEKEVSFDRVVVLRRDGEIEAAERGLGPWRKAGPRAQD